MSLLIANNNCQLIDQQSRSNNLQSAPKFAVQIVARETDLNLKKQLFSTVKNHLSDWAKIATDRYERTKDAPYNEQKHDQAVARNYSLLSLRIRNDIKDFEEQSKKKKFILLLTDDHERIQAIASVYETTNSLYVENMVSAAWNTRMYGQNAAEHAVIKAKGAGTMMMQKIYELAQSHQKSKIRLQAMLQSMSFYRDHLKMSFDKLSQEFSWQVTNLLTA